MNTFVFILVYVFIHFHFIPPINNDFWVPALGQVAVLYTGDQKDGAGTGVDFAFSDRAHFLRVWQMNGVGGTLYLQLVVSVTNERSRVCSGVPGKGTGQLSWAGRSGKTS